MDDNTNTYANAHVRGGLSRARCVRHGVEVCPDCGLNTMGADQHEAVVAELVACTLGARRRPELMVDPFAGMARRLAARFEALGVLFGAWGLRAPTQASFTVAP